MKSVKRELRKFFIFGGAVNPVFRDKTNRGQVRDRVWRIKVLTDTRSYRNMELESLRVWLK